MQIPVPAPKMQRCFSRWHLAIEFDCPLYSASKGLPMLPSLSGQCCWYYQLVDQWQKRGICISSNPLVKPVTESCNYCSLNMGVMDVWPFLSWQPHEDISVVSWNRQVQHILSSAHPSGKAVVWDLRKNEPIIKVSDHSNRVSGGKTVILTSLQHATCDCKTVAHALGIKWFYCENCLGCFSWSCSIKTPLFFPNVMKKQDPQLFLKLGHPYIHFLCSQLICEKSPAFNPSCLPRSTWN